MDRGQYEIIVTQQPHEDVPQDVPQTEHVSAGETLQRKMM
jgi:hypothetical protein